MGRTGIMASVPAISALTGGPLAREDTEFGRATMRRVTLRLLPLLFALYICNFVDRTNLSIAALQMNRDLRFSATAYGLGSGIFFLGYVVFEVPSNLILVRVGARWWIARIMITWGLVASAMMFVRTPAEFYSLRLLLGVAEAGFFPGIAYYLSQWFPSAQRARALAGFMTAIPLSAAVGNPFGAWLLGLDGRLGLHGWQWLFLLEGIPSVVLGVAVLALLTDHASEARWLSADQRVWLSTRLARDEDERSAPHGLSPLRALVHPMVWLVALPYVLVNTAGYGYIFWAPTVIRDTLHVSNMTTGFISGAIACVAAAAMFAIGASSDRTGERCLHAGGGALLAAFGCAGAALMPTPLGRVAGLALMHIGVVSFLVVIWALCSLLLRGIAAAAGMALVNSLANIGGFVGPYLIGWLKDATGGTGGAFLVLGAMALVAAALSLVLRRQTALAPSARAAARALTPAAPVTS
jgi:MFS transporter, ACS family, tartrate transporter